MSVTDKEQLDPASPAVDEIRSPDKVSPRSEPRPAPKRNLGLATGDQLVIGSLAILVLILAGWHWARMSGWGARPIEIERMEPQSLDYQIDINSASYVELLQLDSIGEKLAQRIIDDRKQNGPFESVDDLQRVRGIGPKTVAKLRKHLRAVPPDARAKR